MNKDQAKGKKDTAKGNIKEKVGKAVGNESLEGEGKVDKASGKTRESYGDAKKKVKDATE